MPLLDSTTNEYSAAEVDAARLRQRNTDQLPRNPLFRKYSSNPNFGVEKSLELMETGNSLQQPSTSVSFISTSTNSSLRSRKRPLQQKDFLLDLDDHRNREVLKKDIEKLGGRVVETIDDSSKIFCLVSDYRYAHLLERKNSGNKLPSSTLPMLLRDAVENGIRIRSYATFQQSLLNLKNKMKDEKKRENASAKAHQHLQHGGIKRLSSPFIKLEDSSLEYAPVYKEFASTRYFEPIYLGQLAGKSIFHKVTPEMAERRMREEKDGKKRYPRWNSRLGSGFCDICARNCSNLQLHFTNEEHRRRVSQPSFYDRVDALCGSFTPDIVVPNIPLLERRKSPSPQPIMKKRYWKYDSD
uniref:DBF4-type domain-containing protein n=1 Tax=Syphacia muris TaxID=451379 RepID=A0A158R4U8_9BILA